MYALEPQTRFPAPLHGAGLGAVSPTVMTLGKVALGVGLAWLVAKKTKIGRKVVRKIRRIGK